MTETRSPDDASRPPPKRVALIPDACEQQLWISEATRFMVELHGRPIDLESEEQREGWYQRLGLLLHFISWERGQSLSEGFAVSIDQLQRKGRE